ncbi:hypothetical protein VTI74DRAFT_6783 [Chaetomium olivicolor]
MVTVRPECVLLFQPIFSTSASRDPRGGEMLGVVKRRMNTGPRTRVRTQNSRDHQHWSRLSPSFLGKRS